MSAFAFGVVWGWLLAGVATRTSHLLRTLLLLGLASAVGVVEVGLLVDLRAVPLFLAGVATSIVIFFGFWRVLHSR